MLLESRPPDKPQADYYFFMWNVTDEGLRNLDGLRDSLIRASAMVRRLGGRCQFYVSAGGRYEMVGIAYGINDTQATELLTAVNALGTIRTTTFLKTRDYYLPEFQDLIKRTKDLLQVKA